MLKATILKVRTPRRTRVSIRSHEFNLFEVEKVEVEHKNADYAVSPRHIYKCALVWCPIKRGIYDLVYTISQAFQTYTLEYIIYFMFLL